MDYTITSTRYGWIATCSNGKAFEFEYLYNDPNRSEVIVKGVMYESVQQAVDKLTTEEASDGLHG